MCLDQSWRLSAYSGPIPEGDACESPDGVAGRTVEISVVPETAQPARRERAKREASSQLLLPDWLYCPTGSTATSHA